MPAPRDDANRPLNPRQPESGRVPRAANCRLLRLPTTTAPLWVVCAAGERLDVDRDGGPVVVVAGDFDARLMRGR